MIDKIFRFLSRLRQYLAQRFQRQPDRFLEHLTAQCTLSIEATVALVDYMNKPSKKNAHRVRELENAGDEVRRILIDELNHTFVTPIDREDIHALSRAIDDIMDDTWFTINEMDILGVEPNSFLQQMAQLLGVGAESIKAAIERLEDHPNIATSHAIKAKAVNNDMETLYAEALAALFQKPKDLQKVVDMMKLREIYRHLFHASGRIDDASNIINDIVVKSF